MMGAKKCHHGHHQGILHYKIWCTPTRPFVCSTLLTSHQAPTLISKSLYCVDFFVVPMGDEKIDLADVNPAVFNHPSHDDNQVHEKMRNSRHPNGQ